MNTKRTIGSWIAALAVGSAVMGTSAAVAANGPQRWDICPAIDTVPLCEIVRLPGRSGAAGSDVAYVPVDADRIDDSTGDANDAGKAADWVDSIGINCRRVPWPEIVACPY
jgi:hypothetical protein